MSETCHAAASGTLRLFTLPHTRRAAVENMQERRRRRSVFSRTLVLEEDAASSGTLCEEKQTRERKLSMNRWGGAQQLWRHGPTLTSPP